MDESIEERLARLEGQKPASQNIWKKPIVFVMVLGVVILVIGLVLLFWKQTLNSSTPLPKTVVEQASSPLYYPKSLPDGYAYKEDSAVSDGTTTTYLLENGSKSITVTQQALPKEKLLIDKSPGFTPIGTNVGQAYSGKINGRQVVIVQTGATLITITADGDTSLTDLTQITQNLVDSAD